MDSVTKDILDYLRSLIKKHPKINQKVIAGKLGCSTSQVSQVLRGDRKASIDFIVAVASVIDIPLQDVIIAATNNRDGFRPDSIAETINEYGYENIIEIEHVGIVRRFRNKNLAKAINEKLLALESMNPDELQEIEDYIRFKMDKYDRRKSEQPDKIPKTGDRRKKAG